MLQNPEKPQEFWRRAAVGSGGKSHQEGKAAVSATLTPANQARVGEACYQIKKQRVDTAQSLHWWFLGSGH